MGVHPFQIADLNWNFLQTAPASSNAGSFASEFAIFPDNINANLSRYMKLQAVWANINIGSTSNNPNNDSYGQANANSFSNPLRPDGGYFVRGLYFTNTAVPTNDSTGPFRVGYIGSFVGGLLNCDYVHDPNGSTVDYEPLYSHGAATWPMTASAAKQWRDPGNPPSDGTDAVTNSSSALTRTIYMPPTYHLLHIDSAGSNTLVSGNVKFHHESRPTLHMVGFNDGVNQSGPNSPSWSGVGTYAESNPFAYASDPLTSNQLTSSATSNFHEYYQVSGVRKLNSRGLSFHLAKFLDNGPAAFAYPYEEDGITPGTNVSVGGNTINFPYTYVNDQQEYTWAGGRDQGANNLTTSVSANVVTITFNPIPVPFPVGAIILVQGLTNHPELNGALLTVLTATTTQFTANWTHGNYAAIADNGAVVYKPDFRIREKATFIINEEYYGTVMDTKCAIWSNKSSMFPLIFFDLADTWTASTAKRIAGVSSVPIFSAGLPTWQIFFLSEDGKLARYDFSQTNGVLELAGTGTFTFASNAPAVSAAGEAYGALRARTTQATITNVAITSNVVTVSCTNDFEAGEIVNLTGLTTATFLNNTTLTIATRTGSQFTANFTHANYASTPDTGTALGYSLWVLYGTMTPDPRVTQTGLANTANINLYRYLIGTGVWGTKISSPLIGRHNGRSLNEMIVSRNTNTNPSCLYMIVEDVTSTGGGPWTVANTYSNSGATATSTSVQITSNVATIQAVNTFSAGQTVFLNNYSSANFLNGYNVTVLSTGLSGTQFEFNFTHANYGPTVDSGTAAVVNNVNWQVMAYDPTATAWNTTKINGSLSAGTPLQYGSNFGTPAGQTFNEPRDFWFQSINASLHDLGANKIVIQPNWTAGPNFGANFNITSSASFGLQVLDVSGTTSGLTNSNLTALARTTILPNDSFIGSGGGQTEPATQAVTILHARDFATNGERTVFWFNDLARTQPSGMPVYQAPPSFNWGSPTTLSVIQRNNYPGGNPQFIGSFQKDFWSYPNVSNMLGQFTVRYAWQSPTMLMDNYVHFIIGAAGQDGLPTSCTYGRAFGQSMGFLPTYWKWTGSAWAMADNWTDASTNPYTIPNALVNVPLPYGLQVQFGATGASSYTFGEFQTFNLCYGNTKFARKMRQSYAQFAGQSFTNTDSRSITSQNAVQMFLVDTDIGTIGAPGLNPLTNTVAPTSATPQTATLTQNNLGWTTMQRWSKLDGVNAPFDATPLTTVWNVNSSAFDTTAFAFPAAVNVSGSSPGPYTWTVGATTYAVTASGEQGGNTAYNAVSGNPQNFWQSNTGSTGTLKVDLATAKTVLSYGFRPTYDGNDNVTGTNLKSWTLEGSNDGTFTDNGGGPFVIDTRSNFSAYARGLVFTCNGTTGSHRYYRLNITATNLNQAPTVQMFRLNTSALKTTVNFSELAFFAYGSGVSPSYNPYQFLRNWNMARGIKLEVSTNNAASYTTVFAPGGPSPYWRALNGYVFTFPRQTGVTNVRITCQHGFNYNQPSPNGNNQPLVTAFGPFYFIDYGDGGGSYGSDTTQATINAARLGNSLAPVGTPAIASFDPNCLGVSTDTQNISIDGANPSNLVPPNTFNNTSVLGWWDFGGMLDAAHSTSAIANYKAHPFFGFIFFQGAGGDNGVSTQTGTTAVINYQWGRRV